MWIEFEVTSDVSGYKTRKMNGYLEDWFTEDEIREHGFDKMEMDEIEEWLSDHLQGVDLEYEYGAGLGRDISTMYAEEHVIENDTVTEVVVEVYEPNEEM